jgi:hypothetical protein
MGLPYHAVRRTALARRLERLAKVPSTASTPAFAALPVLSRQAAASPSEQPQ